MMAFRRPDGTLRSRTAAIISASSFWHRWSSPLKSPRARLCCGRPVSRSLSAHSSSSTRCGRQEEGAQFQHSIFCMPARLVCSAACRYSGTDCFAKVSADMVSTIQTPFPNLDPVTTGLLAALSRYAMPGKDGCEIFDAFFLASQVAAPSSSLALVCVGVIMALL